MCKKHACMLRCMHSQHQRYDAVTIAEHHVLVRDGLCRASCAWEGELWMFVSGGRGVCGGIGGCMLECCFWVLEDTTICTYIYIYV